jgi:hypothetical protein
VSGVSVNKCKHELERMVKKNLLSPYIVSQRTMFFVTNSDASCCTK